MASGHCPNGFATNANHLLFTTGECVPMKKIEEKNTVKLTLTKETVAHVATKTGVKAGGRLSISFAVKGTGGACCA